MLSNCYSFNLLWFSLWCFTVYTIKSVLGLIWVFLFALPVCLIASLNPVLVISAFIAVKWPKCAVLIILLISRTYVSQIGRIQAASFGGSNIDPTAWEDKKCKGESRFPAQVKIGFLIWILNNLVDLSGILFVSFTFLLFNFLLGD